MVEESSDDAVVVAGRRRRREEEEEEELVVSGGGLIAAARMAADGTLPNAEADATAEATTAVVRPTRMIVKNYYEVVEKKLKALGLTRVLPTLCSK